VGTSLSGTYQRKFGGQLSIVNMTNWITGVQSIVYGAYILSHRDLMLHRWGAHIGLVCGDELRDQVACC
jgi:hypothetical protein